MALDLLPVLAFLGLDDELLGLGLLFFLVLAFESSPDSFFFDFLFFLTGRRCQRTNNRVNDKILTFLSFSAVLLLIFNMLFYLLNFMDSMLILTLIFFYFPSSFSVVYFYLYLSFLFSI